MLISIEHNPSPAKLEVMGVYDWPIWEKHSAEFAWTYDRQETCYFLEGQVTVTPEGGEPVAMGKGDLVIFPAGLCCRWHITEMVRKHYDFA